MFVVRFIVNVVVDRIENVFFVVSVFVLKIIDDLFGFSGYLVVGMVLEYFRKVNRG